MDSREYKINRGFTMVELLGVIAILAIVILIAIPTFAGIRERTNESLYETKLANARVAAESFSEESGRMVFDIRTLIKEGKLEADNESGEYLNPLTGKDMRCYVIDVRYENLQYYANIHESSVCMDEAEMEAIYGAVKIGAYNQSKTDKVTPYYMNWYNEPIYISYELTETANYKTSNIVKIAWQGDRSITCTKDAGNLEDCTYFGRDSLGSAGTITNTNVSLEITFRNDQGVEFSSKTSKLVSIDMESPKVLSVTPGLGITNQSGKRVDIELTDGNGSGLMEYKMVKVDNASSPLPVCKNLDGYKPVTQSKMVEYQDNGIYYTCVRDNVGNDNQATLSYTKTEVTGVDYSHVNGKRFKIASSGESTPLKVKATIEVEGREDTSKLKMCVSNTGFLKGCSWETFRSNFDWKLAGNADCNNRTVYLSITDEAGNVTNLVSNRYAPVDTVKYNANGGSLKVATDNKKTACYDGRYVLPAAQRVGYSFEGWYTDKGIKITNTSKVDFNGVRTLQAHWKINSYTISYNLDGGAYGKNHPASAKYNQKIKIDHPTRVGYSFNGWNITGMDSTTHNYGSATTNQTSLSKRKETEYMNLRATPGVVKFKSTWVANKYSISYNLDGGTFGVNHPTSATYNVAFTVNNPSKKGYIFVGWNITGMDNSGHTYGNRTTNATSLKEVKETTYKNLRTTSGVVVFKAVWKSSACDNCTVTFDSNGGYWDEKSDECYKYRYISGTTVDSDELVNIRYYKKDGSNCYFMIRHYTPVKLGDSSACRANFDLFYSYTTINGKFTRGYCRLNHPTTKTSAVKKGKIQEFPIEPYKIGYYFDGWFTERTGGTKIGENTIVSENTTYYAHFIDLAGTFDINNYAQSKNVACRDDLFQRLIDTYTSKFKDALNNSQNFRNAMYDCGEAAERSIKASQNGFPTFRQTGRLAIVSGNGRDADCTCYPNKESKSAEKKCRKPACNSEYEQFSSGTIYGDRVFILSATVEKEPPVHGSGGGKCADQDGYGGCSYEGSSWEVDGYRAILMGPSNGEVNEVVGWGYCNSRTNNAILNYGECSDETENRIGRFMGGLRVGLYSCIDKWYDNDKNDRTYNDFKNYTVYVQIFKI